MLDVNTLHRNMVDAVEQAVIATDLDGSVVGWNRFAERMYGWAADEMMGRGIIDVVVLPGDREAGRGVIERVKRGERWSGEFVLKRRDGSSFPALVVAGPLCDEDGAVFGLVGVSLDITDRVRAEEERNQLLAELRAAYAYAETERMRLHTLFVTAPAFLAIVTGPDHVYELANPLYHQIVGRSDIVGRPVSAVLPELREHGFLDLLNAVYTTGEPYTGYEMAVATVPEDGEAPRQRILNFVLQPIRNAAGTTAGIAIHGVDVSTEVRQRRQTQELLEELQRLNRTLESRVSERTAQVRALSRALTLAEQRERRRISRMLHDDLQQMLFSAQIKVARLKSAVGEDDEAGTSVRELSDLMYRAVQSTRTLSVELDPPVLDDEGLSAALEWVGSHMRAMHDLQVQVDLQPDLPEIDQDRRVLLCQIVRELLFNVVKHAGVRSSGLRAYASNGTLTLEVNDRGRGFDADAALAAPRGAAHGLFSIRERLRLFGGDLVVTSAFDGTTAAITLPLEYSPGMDAR